MDKPLSEQTPVEIDTALYALYREQFRLQWQAGPHAMLNLHYAVKDRRNYGYAARGTDREWDLTAEQVIDRAEAILAGEVDFPSYEIAEVERAVAEWYDVKERARANAEAQAPLRAEYRSRPWTRAFLVTDGHVHSSQDCSTCFETTKFSWLTDLSGKDEDEIVELAGERACTVCYPTAPTLRSFEKASPLFTEEERERNAARDQRAAEKQARLAKKIANGLTEDGSEFVVVYEEGVYPEDHHMRQYAGKPYARKEHFKTERAAVQWMVQEICWGHRSNRAASDRYEQAYQAIVEAVARKHSKSVEDVWSEIEAKVVAKNKRDSR